MQISVKTNPPYIIKIESGSIINSGLPNGFVITDKNVYLQYSHLIKSPYFIIDGSEKSKTLEVYSKIIEKIGEEDTIIAFGGGVVGDLAGFVASTYKRGINLVQIPTTLLAMVDSSIGGKNGINLGEKKNYIGTTYPPKEVLIDPLFLKTLPKTEISNGFAEIIKYAYLFNSPKIENLNLDGINEHIEKIIFDCCKNKAEVVEEDILDKGYRHILNFGHTIGHGIEIISGLSHGEAISVGMVKEMEIGIKLGITNKIQLENLKETLLRFNLPINIPPALDKTKILTLIEQDKKGKFIFALSPKEYSIKVEKSIIQEVLK